MLKNRFMNRINSDRADANSVSMLLWIVIAVVIVMVVGTIIYKALVKKGRAVSDCIDKSNTLIGNSDSAERSCAGGSTK